jgi:hypothetical protein
MAMPSVEAANECRQQQIGLSLHAGLGKISGIELKSYRKQKRELHLSVSRNYIFRRRQNSKPSFSTSGRYLMCPVTFGNA